MTNPSDALRVVVGNIELAHSEHGSGGLRLDAAYDASDFILEHGAALAQALENDARWRSFRRTISINADDMTPERWDKREDSFMADYADAYDPAAIAAKQKEAEDAR